MKKQTIQELKERFDSVSIKGNVITVREAFFYTFGKSEADLVIKVKTMFPNALILEKGVKNFSAPFRGSASVKQSPHWYVKFRM